MLSTPSFVFLFLSFLVSHEDAYAADRNIVTRAGDFSESDAGKVCRAVVAVLNGRDVEIIRVYKFEKGMPYVSYKRPDDGKVWKNRCKFDGNRVIWSGVDIPGYGPGPGRWRDGPYDEKIVFEIREGGVLLIMTYDDGSAKNVSEKFVEFLR